MKFSKIIKKGKLDCTYSIVHIDDSPIILRFWKRHFEGSSYKLLSLSNSLELFENLLILNKKTLFFIDQELGVNNLTGVEIIEILFKLGFRNLYLSTSYESSMFNNPKIKGVICKRPPSFFLKNSPLPQENQ